MDYVQIFYVKTYFKNYSNEYVGYYDLHYYYPHCYLSNQTDHIFYYHMVLVHHYLY